MFGPAPKESLDSILDIFTKTKDKLVIYISDTTEDVKKLKAETTTKETNLEKASTALSHVEKLAQ